MTRTPQPPPNANPHFLLFSRTLGSGAEVGGRTKPTDTGLSQIPPQGRGMDAAPPRLGPPSLKTGLLLAQLIPIHSFTVTLQILLSLPCARPWGCKTKFVPM